MAKDTINITDLEWFQSVFDLEAFLHEPDFRKKPWIKGWNMLMTDWFNLNEMDAIESDNLKNIFKDSSEIVVTSFPLSLHQEKQVLLSVDALSSFLKQEDTVGILPALIYSSDVLLIVEPDLELLIIGYPNESEKIKNTFPNELSYATYSKHISDLKTKGFL